MKLAGVNTSIRDLFRITKLLDIFDIHQTVDDAVKDQPQRAASV